MISETQYIDQAEHPDVITRGLRPLVRFRERPLVRRRLLLLDTFNGRIASAGARLATYPQNGEFRIEWQPRDRHVRLQLSLKTWAEFAWDLPSGALRDSLQPIISVRRLVPQVEVEIHGRILDVLDNDRKTVARIRIEAGRARSPSRGSPWRGIPTLVTLTALKGYGETYERLVRILESRPNLERSAVDLQMIAVRTVGGSTPRDHSKSKVALDPSTRSAEGARRLHRALLEIMLENERGVREGLDTEFLHDYRVSLRRTRSLLGQIKDVFPEDITAHYRNEFRWLAQATNPVRDLDVLLLRLRRISETSPSEDLASLCTFLIHRQKTEQRSLIRLLESDRYQTLVASWRNFLEIAPPEYSLPPNAERPLVEVTSHRIWHLYRRLAHQARVVEDITAANVIHQARITAKKLRYMIDATVSLNPVGHLNRIIERLKGMQAVLGEFNDAQVQEMHLLAIGKALAENGETRAATLMTVGALAGDARTRGEALRTRVSRELSRFSKADIRSDFRRLFKHSVRSEPTP